MKKFIKLILALTLLIAACSKNDEDNKPKIAKEITADELMKYKIVEEFAVKPANTATYGEYPILFVTYFTKENGVTKISMAHFGNISSDITTNNITYSSQTGITTIKTQLGHYELTRDIDDKIVLASRLHMVDAAVFKEHWTSNHAQLIYLENTIRPNLAEYFELGLANNTYSAVINENTIIYEFDDETKWMIGFNIYPQSYPWTYRLLTKTIGRGRDDGTAKYENLFLDIPSGNGWKGQQKEEALLLVNTWNANRQTTGPVGLFKKYPKK